jgi:hypothetical protein
MSLRIKQDFFNLNVRLWQIREDGKFLIYLGVIVLIGVCLRLVFLGQPIRYDEAFTYNIFAAHGVREILTNYGQPNNHIFHTLMVYIATSLFGNQPWIIRLPAFISGILVVPITYVAARIYYDKESALLSAALVATSSSLIEYSTNARGYEFICLFTLLMLVLARYIKDENNLAAWLFFSITAVLGFFTIPVMLYPYGGLMSWLFISWLVRDTYIIERTKFLKNMILSALAVGVFTGLLYLPVIVVSGLDKLVSNQFVRPENWSQGVSTFLVLSSAMWGHWNTDMPLLGSLILLLGFIISLVYYKKLSSDKIPLAVVLILWCIGLMLLTHRVPPWTRVFLFLLPLYLIWSSVGLVYLISRIHVGRKYISAPVLAGLVLSVAILLGLNLMYTRSVYRSEQTGTLRDGHEIAKWLGNHLQPSDAVISFAPSDAILQYYFDKDKIGVKLYSEMGRVRDFKRAFIVTNIANQQSYEFILSKVGFLDDVDLSTAQLVQSFPSADIIEIH